MHSFCEVLCCIKGKKKCPGQCDQIVRFLKILCVKFSLKSSPNVYSDFLGFLKHHFSRKNAVATFLGNFWKTFGYVLFQHMVTLVGGQASSVRKKIRKYFLSFNETSLKKRLLRVDLREDIIGSEHMLYLVSSVTRLGNILDFLGA